MDPLDNVQLKKRLIQAYLHDAEITISPAWQKNVMHKIWQAGPLTNSIADSLEPESSSDLFFQELVWKMAPVLCLLLIFLFTGMFSQDLYLESLVSETFIDDPMVIIYSSIFWG